MTICLPKPMEYKVQRSETKGQILWIYFWGPLFFCTYKERFSYNRDDMFKICGYHSNRSQGHVSKDQMYILCSKTAASRLADFLQTWRQVLQVWKVYLVHLDVKAKGRRSDVKDQIVWKSNRRLAIIPKGNIAGTEPSHTIKITSYTKIWGWSANRGQMTCDRK